MKRLMQAVAETLVVLATEHEANLYHALTVSLTHMLTVPVAIVKDGK